MIALLLLAIALSMDAFAVAIGLGAKHRQDTTKLRSWQAYILASFKVLMPLIGYLGGRSILDLSQIGRLDCVHYFGGAWWKNAV